MEAVCAKLLHFFAKLAARSTKRREKEEVQKLMDVLFDVCMDVKERHFYVKKVHDCKHLFTERTTDAFSKKRFWKEKLRSASRNPKSSAVLYKKNVPNAVRKQLLSTTSDSVFRSEDGLVELASSTSAKYSTQIELAV